MFELLSAIVQALIGGISKIFPSRTKRRNEVSEELCFLDEMNRRIEESSDRADLRMKELCQKEKQLTIARIQGYGPVVISAEESYQLSIVSSYFFAIGLVWILGSFMYFSSDWADNDWSYVFGGAPFLLMAAAFLLSSFGYALKKIRSDRLGLRRSRTGTLVDVSEFEALDILSGLGTSLNWTVRASVSIVATFFGLVALYFILALTKSILPDNLSQLILVSMLIASLVTTVVFFYLFTSIDTIFFNSKKKIILDELKECDESCYEMQESSTSFRGIDIDSVVNRIKTLNVSQVLSVYKSNKLKIPREYTKYKQKGSSWNSACFEFKLYDKDVFMSVTRFPLNGIQEKERKGYVGVVLSESWSEGADLDAFSSRFGMLIQIWPQNKR